MIVWNSLPMTSLDNIHGPMIHHLTTKLTCPYVEDDRENIKVYAAKFIKKSISSLRGKDVYKRFEWEMSVMAAIEPISETRSYYSKYIKMLDF